MDSSGGPSSPRFRQAAAGENGLLNLPSSSATTSDTGLSSGGFGGAAGSSMVSGLTRIASTLKQEAAHDPFLRMMSAASEGAADRLLVAAEKGDLPTVEAALAAGVDPNKVAGRNGFTPLHHAVRRGHVGVAQALLTLCLGLHDGAYLCLGHRIALHGARQLHGLRHIDNDYPAGQAVLPGFDQQGGNQQRVWGRSGVQVGDDLIADQRVQQLLQPLPLFRRGKDSFAQGGSVQCPVVE